MLSYFSEGTTYFHTWRPFFSLIWRNQELTKFINHCNEVKAATLANKEGGQLSIVKPPAESSATAGNKKDSQPETAEA